MDKKLFQWWILDNDLYRFVVVAGLVSFVLLTHTQEKKKIYPAHGRVLVQCSGSSSQSHSRQIDPHTSDEEKLCFECGGLETSSLSNLTGLWLRFRSETQLIYHATFRLSLVLPPPPPPPAPQGDRVGRRRRRRQRYRLVRKSAKVSTSHRFKSLPSARLAPSDRIKVPSQVLPILDYFPPIE